MLFLMLFPLETSNNYYYLKKKKKFTSLWSVHVIKWRNNWEKAAFRIKSVTGIVDSVVDMYDSYFCE